MGIGCFKEDVGYDRDEIANEVIRAMVPSFTRRNVLETTTEFSGEPIEEKRTIDLWSKLTSLTQSPEESCYSFLVRCIELRQKIQLASTKSDIKLDKSLLGKVFCHTLERGLSST